MDFLHTSVLLNECIEGLNIKEDGIYVDGTAGGGGHSEAILKKLKDGLLISIDQDPDAIHFLKQKFSASEKSVIKESNFSQIDKIVEDLGLKGVDGVLLDIGVSSYQLDNPNRGFSYNNDSRLDMRMSKEGVSAFDVVNGFPHKELVKIIYNFGEERYAKRISDEIVRRRDVKKIETTFELVEIIKSAIPVSVRRKLNHHPARKTFQAIRIAVNDELGNLMRGLDAAFNVLNKGGRIAVITFHSLEDRIVKQKMNEWCRGCECPKDFPVCVCGKLPRAKLVNKKPVIPSENEIDNNARSRSAKLRICEKL